VGELAHDHVEFGVTVWQLFGVSFMPVDLYASYGCILASTRKQFRGKVDRTHSGAKPRRSDGDHTCATTNIQTTLPGLNIGEAHQACRRWSGQCLQGREIGPTFFLDLLELS
jgi:hypothetical protein